LSEEVDGKIVKWEDHLNKQTTVAYEEAKVKTLFYGAGVLGSLYVARLQEAG